MTVPPYVVFHDKSLKEMVFLKPDTVEDLLQVTGVGASKAQRFGKIFLDCIRGEEIDLSRYLDRIQPS